MDGTVLEDMVSWTCLVSMVQAILTTPPPPSRELFAALTIEVTAKEVIEIRIKETLSFKADDEGREEMSDVRDCKLPSLYSSDTVGISDSSITPGCLGAMAGCRGLEDVVKAALLRGNKHGRICVELLWLRNAHKRLWLCKDIHCLSDIDPSSFVCRPIQMIEADSLCKIPHPPPSQVAGAAESRLPTFLFGNRWGAGFIPLLILLFLNYYHHLL